MDLEPIRETRENLTAAVRPALHALHVDAIDPDRWLKIFAGGGALVAAGVARRSPVLASVLALGGGALLLSGITGRTFSSLLPSREENVSRAVTIFLPRHQVFAAFQSPETRPSFLGDHQFIHERAPELLQWIAGQARFRDAQGRRATEVHVTIHVTRPLTAHRVTEDLRRFKQLLEVGHVATTEGQSSGREAER